MVSLKTVTVIQSQIASETGVPLDSANVLSICLQASLKTTFLDFNQTVSPEELAAIVGSDVVYLSLYTVVPMRPETEIPLTLKIVADLKRRGVRLLILGCYRLPDKWIPEILAAGVDQIFLGDTAYIFKRFLEASTSKERVIRQLTFETLNQNLIPDYRQINLKSYRTSIFSNGKNALPLVLSRGCKNECTYCDVKGSPPAQLSSDQIFVHLNSLVDSYRINHFMIEDDLFNSSTSRLKEFCHIMKTHFQGVTWECLNGIHPTHLDEESLKEMAEAGCIHFAIGLECFDSELLRSKKRMYDLDKVLKLISYAKSQGITVSGYLLFDFMEEASGGYFSQLKKLKQSPLSLIHISSLKVLGPKLRLIKSFSYLYLYTSPCRVVLLYRMKVFSRKYLLRSLDKLLKD